MIVNNYMYEVEKNKLKQTGLAFLWNVMSIKVIPHICIAHPYCA